MKYNYKTHSPAIYYKLFGLKLGEDMDIKHGPDMLGHQQHD